MHTFADGGLWSGRAHAADAADAVSKVPAVLVCDAATANLDIAGLTVLDRLVVTAHRAGCAPIFIAAKTMPPLERAHALGVEITVSAETSRDISGLMITGGVLVASDDLRRVIEADGQLVARDGSALPVRMVPSDVHPIIALGAAHAVTNAATAREAERKLWDSLGSSADGLVDRLFNRPLGRELSKRLVHTPITPNQVSVASILTGVASAPLFAAGNFIGGAVVLQVCAILDCVDGDLARALFKQSAVGKWLDIGGDQVVHFSAFAAIGIGVARNYPSVPALTLGASAAIGVLLCFPVIIRGLRQPAEERGFLLNKLMDATANRDFTVLLLLFAVIGRMDLFLWLAGIGIHVFWIALLLLQQAGRAPVPTRRNPV